eukprot:3642044-Rhodomonas_salina.1
MSSHFVTQKALFLKYSGTRCCIPGGVLIDSGSDAASEPPRPPRRREVAVSSACLAVLSEFGCQTLPELKASSSDAQHNSPNGLKSAG